MKMDETLYSIAEKCKNFCGPNKPLLKSLDGCALPIFLASREQGAPLTVSPLQGLGKDVEKYKTKMSRATGSLSVQLLRRSC